jgi:hypothetical protein
MIFCVQHQIQVKVLAIFEIKMVIICGEFFHKVNNRRLSKYLMLEHTRTFENKDLCHVICGLKAFLT